MPTILKSVSLDFNLNKEQELYLKNCYDNKNLMDLKNISTEIHDISSKLLNRIGPLDKIYQFLFLFLFFFIIYSNVKNQRYRS